MTTGIMLYNGLMQPMQPSEILESQACEALLFSLGKCSLMALRFWTVNDSNRSIQSLANEATVRAMCNETRCRSVCGEVLPTLPRHKRRRRVCIVSTEYDLWRDSNLPPIVVARPRCVREPGETAFARDRQEQMWLKFEKQKPYLHSRFACSLQIWGLGGTCFYQDLLSSAVFPIII